MNTLNDRKSMSLLVTPCHVRLSDHALMMNDKSFPTLSSLLIRIGIPHHSIVKGSLTMRHGLILNNNLQMVLITRTFTKQETTVIEST